jgi:muramidase (phage lysozyme)
MQFYLGEKNIGNDATRDQVDQIITHLKNKGWNVFYGTKENTPETDDDKMRQRELEDAFAEDFMTCLDDLGI